MRHDTDSASVRLVRATLDAVSALDTEAVLASLHHDYVFELPYERGMGPLDKNGMARLLAGLAESFHRFTMNIVEIVESVDPELLVVRYEGDCLSKDGTVKYRNSYVGFFSFTDGLISGWREYANPVLTRKMNERLAAVGRS